MKNYRFLIALCLPAFMLLSIYMLISNAKEKESRLQALEHTAEQQIADGLHEKAANTYSEMIEINNDIGYYLSATEMYYDADKIQQCIAWAEHTKESFPDRPEGYEWLVKLYSEDGYIDRAYEAIDEFDGRKLSSQMMDEYKAKLNASYYVDYTNVTDVSAFSSGYIALEKKELWGLGNAKGKTAIKPEYSYVGFYSNERVPVRDTDGIWYFMDSNGEFTSNISTNIDGNILDVGLYNNDLFPVNVDGVYSYYTSNFVKKHSDYEFAGPYSGGVAAVKSDGKWRIIDTNGDPVLEEQFDDIALDARGVCCVKNIIMAKKGEYYYLYDSNGRCCSENGYIDAKCAGPDGIVAVKEDGLWGFVDEKGEILISPQFLDAQSFSNGFAAVRNTLNWGYIDLSGRTVIDYQFAKCTSFSDKGAAFVKSGDEWSVIRLYRLNH